MSDHDKAPTAAGLDSEKLSELEISLTVLWNSVRRWLSKRSSSSAVNGLSDLDVFLLHMLVYRNQANAASGLELLVLPR